MPRRADPTGAARSSAGPATILIQRRLKGDQVGADQRLARRHELLTRDAETRTHRRVGVVAQALGVGPRDQEQTGGDRREFSTRDIEYVRDLGLIAHEGALRIANPIYAEAIPRELTWATQIGLAADTAWYVDADGGLNVVKLLAAIQEFFREHSEHWVQRFDYLEAGPQLLLQAFLQRVVNGGGRIEREYGLGRGRTDLLIVWPQGEATRRFVVEYKVLHKSLGQTVRDGLAHTAAYMDRCGAQEGHLVLFDRTEGKPWADKLFRREEPVGGGAVTVWGM